MAGRTRKPEQTTSPKVRGEKSFQVRFSTKKILGMKRYANRVDLLSALLHPDAAYTVEAVDAAIGDFMKGKVN